MNPTPLESSLRRISPERQNAFFGYYDIPAWSPDGKKHLGHLVEFRDRLPTADDAARIAVLDVDSGEANIVAETTAWNFQQGAMLRWFPLDPSGSILFNARSDAGFCGQVLELSTGKARTMEKPVVEIDPMGTWAAGMNYSRRFDFRAGYGYAGIPDPFENEPQPTGDGIFWMDPADGRAELRWSLAELGERFPAEGGKNRKLLIDTVNSNPSGTKAICFLRAWPLPGRNNWGTAVLVLDMVRDDVRLLQDFSFASHYHWKDDETIVMVIRREDGLITPALISTETGSVEYLDTEYFLADGHCSFSPDLEWMLYDSYLIEDRRFLYVYNLRDRKGFTLGSVLSEKYNGDTVRMNGRCDLHPRWSPDGKSLSLDSIHEGYRGIYVLDEGPLEELKQRSSESALP